MKSKIFAAVLAVALGIGFSVDVHADSREDIAKINVKNASRFKYWNKESQSKKRLVDFVKQITNRRSEKFIPKEDRIAVFDCDGTLIGERSPFYYEWLIYLHRTLEDENLNISVEEKTYAKDVLNAIRLGNITTQADRNHDNHFPANIANQTPEAYKEYVRKYLDTVSVEGYNNLKQGEAFFLPMVEIVTYLKNHGFQVYVITGGERDGVRVMVGDILHIPPKNVIGTDHSLYAEHQGNESDLNYVYGSKNKDEKILRGDKVVFKNLNFNKIIAMNREIGQRPVLAFGNSMGDSSMFNYTVCNNKYPALAFSVLCDDLERENGSIEKADNMRKNCEKYGWIPISMKNEWKTIYGYKVKKIN